jgi:hypothetical protein
MVCFSKCFSLMLASSFSTTLHGFWTVALLLAFSQPSFSQKATLTGYVTDSTSGEVLIGATIATGDLQGGVVTNKYGFFSLTIPRDPTKVIIRYMGYLSKEYRFTLAKDSTIFCGLTPSSQLLQEVVISSDKQQAETPLGLVALSLDRLKTVPALLGEADVLKAFSLTPGVSVGNEGTAGLLVRGGTPDQNLILLDEATVYNVSHLFGFVSIFHTNALKKVDLYKAGFPARFGGRLSSVVDITMKEGNKGQRQGEWSLGLLSSRFMWEGPLNRKKQNPVAFMLSGRSSYLGLFTLPNYISFIRGNESQYVAYWLYDINAKVNQTFQDGSQWMVSFYRGTDSWSAGEASSAVRSRSDLNWGNTTLTARYTRMLYPKLFFRSLLIYSKYKYGLSTQTKSLVNIEGASNNRFGSQSSVRDYTIKLGVDYMPSNRHQIKVGIESVAHRYQPSKIQSSYFLNPDTLTKVNQHIPASENTLYAEDDISLSAILKANIGLRSVLFHVQGRNYPSLEPRLTINYLLPSFFALKGAYSQMRQFIHLLSNNSIGLPNDIFVPATSKVPPQFSQQLAAGITKTLQDYNLEVSVEGYYKTSHHLIDYQNGANLLTAYNNSWEESIEKNGVAKAYGMEVFINKTQGKFTGWIAYTLAWNRRKFATLNNGRWYAAPYDRRHTVAWTGSYALGKHVTLSANWTFHSGQPFTLPVALRKNINNDLIYLIYSDRNNVRMPVYHRMDVNINFLRTTRKNRQATWSLGIYNVYNRINAYYLDISRLYVFEEAPNLTVTGTNFSLRSIGALPILPSLTYTLKY